MRAGMSFKRIAVLLAFAAGGAVSAQGQIMYAGPGAIVQHQFWNPQVYGYNTYPYLAPGPYTRGFLVPPSGAVVVPPGQVLPAPGAVARPFAYGYPPNPYRSRVPRLYGPPPRPYRGYQPGPYRPHFANPYDPPAPPHQNIRAPDNATPSREQHSISVPTERNGQADAPGQVNRRADDGAKEPAPQGHVMPVDGSQDSTVEQGGQMTAERKPKGTAAPADANQPAD